MTETFDHEKLDVYTLQLEFVSWSSRLLDEVVEGGPAQREVRDHLSRAALSVLLNLAEGNGKRARRVRAKFFDDARGSATECAACLDALVALGACSERQVASGKEMLLRVVAMLTKLVLRFSNSRTAEAEAEYMTAEDEHEDEDEHDLGSDDDEDERSATQPDTQERD